LSLVALDRITPAPIQSEQFTTEFKMWLSVTVDSLNEIIEQIERALNP